MSVEKLQGLLKAPTQPPDSAVNWSEIEEAIKIALPSDYKRFIEVYGTGCIADSIWVLSPKSGNKHLNLIEQVRRRLDAMKAFRTGGDIPYSIFPEPGGLIPWAFTDNGDVLYWRTGSPDANSWPTVVHDSRVSRWEEFLGTMTEFLTVLLSREYAGRMFPAGFPPISVEFIPK
jgi:hypothetical protein